MVNGHSLQDQWCVYMYIVGHTLHMVRCLMCSSVSVSASVGKLNTWHYQFGNDYTSCYSVVGTCTHSMHDIE